MFQAVKFPASITDLTTSLSKMYRDTLTLKNNIVNMINMLNIGEYGEYDEYTEYTEYGL